MNTYKETIELREHEAQAHQLDANDALAHLRERFYCPEDHVYLDGNSLGLLSRDAETSLLRVLDEWRTLAIEGWLEAETPWFTLAETLAAQLSPLIGAEPDSVIVTNSTTVNLHQLLATLFDPIPGRDTILADSVNFPSDLYALKSHLRLRGLDPEQHLQLVESKDGLTLDEDAIIAAMTDRIRLILLPSVVYTSGQLLDIARLTAEAHRRDIMIGFDCSHSIGALPHSLDEWGVDFAFWCSYKYLCAGPGAAGGLYLNRRHHARAPGMAGWFGCRKDRQFAMSPDFDVASGAGGLQIGTPNILSMAPLQGALEVIAEAGIDALRAKSLALTEYLIMLADTYLAEFGVTIATPRLSEKRGGHVALRHPEAARICRALRDAGVTPDFRPPDIIRLAPVALYNSYSDCFTAIHKLCDIVQNRSYEAYPTERGLVP